jgi:F-type H+-transporting ATPase subunit delta
MFAVTEVGHRYAKAAFDLATDPRVEAVRTVEIVSQDVTRLSDLLKASEDLRRLMTSVTFSSADKLKGLLAVTAAEPLHPLTQKTLGLMAQKGRLSALGSFIGSFLALYEAYQGKVSAHVTSAVALSDKQLTDLKAALSQALGLEPEVSTHIDPAILGGLRIKVGSKLFDASLKTKLDSLKFALKRA